MKSIKDFTVYMLNCIVVLVSFTACSKDDNIVDQPTSPPTGSYYPLSDVKVTASGYIKAGVKSNAFTAGNGPTANDVTITHLTEEEAKAYSESTTGDEGKTIFLYRWTTLNYRCNTADGTQKDLSELVVWPFRTSDLSPSHLVVGCHSTITSNNQCPSNFKNLSSLGEINILALFAAGVSQKALVVIPDYEGYGITADIPHPYCNRELTAEQVVTGVKAGLSYFEANVTKMDDNWTGVAIGYSQGGAVSAGVLRYCQEHNESALRLQGAVCGDGPYDPLATLKRYIDMDKLYMPVAPAMLLKGAIDTDPDMKAIGCNYQDFVTEAFYNTGIFEMIASKQNTTDDIQAALLDHSLQNGDNGGFTMKALCDDGYLPYTQSNLTDGNGNKRSFELENGKGYNFCTVDQCLKPEVIQYFRDGTISGDVPEAKLKALEKSLAKNALTADNYMPGKGFTFFHSIGDEVVPYCNFESVRNTWGVESIVALSYQSNTTLHVATGTSFFLAYCGDLVDEILKGKWAPREETVGGGLW
jgi:hypothetical protein